MAIFNLGSINIDHFYEVDHLPTPGETLASLSYRVGLGGKGANQSIAAARAGAQVRHIGAVGAEGQWCKAQLSDAGVDTENVNTVSEATGHANICIDTDGENLIILYSGANSQVSGAQVDEALSDARPGDYLILQNETGLTLEAAQTARALGMFVVYSAAPFDAPRAIQMLPVVDLLVVNEVEAQQLSKALGAAVEDFDVPNLLITKGANGAVWRIGAAGESISVDAFKVDPVDTTGAGDCFIGNTVAALDRGMTIADAIQFGSAASAIQVTRQGTAGAMPSWTEVNAFLTAVGSD